MKLFTLIKRLGYKNSPPIYHRGEADTQFVIKRNNNIANVQKNREIYLMNVELADILTVIGSVIGAMGGVEAIKWGVTAWRNRKTDARIEDARADAEEFKALREYNEFLQKQLSDKEERFVEQTGRLRQVQDELFALKESYSDVKLELAMKRCERKKCGDREPQNGY
jgi:hypothetical protein